MRIVCIGDSCTYGQGVAARDSWPGLLAQYLAGDMRDFDVRNEGVCGDTTRLGLARWDTAVALHRPELVVIQFGHNDANTWETDLGRPRVSEQSYRANIAEMLSRVACWGGTAIVLLPHDCPNREGAYRARLLSYQAALGGIGRRPPAATLLADGYDVHPDHAMHERYAGIVMGEL